MVELALVFIGVSLLLQWLCITFFVISIIREKKKQKQRLNEITDQLTAIAKSAQTSLTEAKKTQAPAIPVIPFGKIDRN